MFCSYLSQFSTVLAKNWTVGKFAGIRTLTRTRTCRYPYPKPAGVAKPLQFPNDGITTKSTCLPEINISNLPNKQWLKMVNRNMNVDIKEATVIIYIKC